MLHKSIRIALLLVTPVLLFTGVTATGVNADEEREEKVHKKIHALAEYLTLKIKTDAGDGETFVNYVKTADVERDLERLRIGLFSLLHDREKYEIDWWTGEQEAYTTIASSCHDAIADSLWTFLYENVDRIGPEEVDGWLTVKENEIDEVLCDYLVNHEMNDQLMRRVLSLENNNKEAEPLSGEEFAMYRMLVENKLEQAELVGNIVLASQSNHGEEAEFKKAPTFKALRAELDRLGTRFNMIVQVTHMLFDETYESDEMNFADRVSLSYYGILQQASGQVEKSEGLSAEEREKNLSQLRGQQRQLIETLIEQKTLRTLEQKRVAEVDGLLSKNKNRPTEVNSAGRSNDSNETSPTQLLDEVRSIRTDVDEINNDVGELKQLLKEKSKTE